MSLSSPAPTNAAAEWSTLSRMLTEPEIIGEIVGVPLAQEDFSLPETRLIYATTVQRHYAGQPIDPLIVGELAKDELAAYWSADPNAVGELLSARVRNAMSGDSVLEHAAIVKRLSTGRRLLTLAQQAAASVVEGSLTPEEIGDQLSTGALEITSGSVRRSEVRDWMSVGSEYVVALQRVIDAKRNGIEIGVYTGLQCIDKWTTGIAPGELCFLAGEPGVGKTALAWAAGMGFAARQVRREREQQVGTLLLSMEMNLYSSTARLVSMLTGIDGTQLREGSISPDMYQRILTEWKNRENLPLYFNFASNFRLSQMRALIAEAIRRHNVGFVVIDHFRMIDTDRRYTNPNQEDEAKVRFIKENIAKDLNVAVMCLAHTIKVGRGQGGESPKPRLSDLRGSGQVAAHADFVAMAYNPNAYVDDDPDADEVEKGDMELLWVKNRFGDPASAAYRFDAPRMRITDR